LSVDKIDEHLVRLTSGTEEERVKSLQWLTYDLDPAESHRVFGVIRNLTSDESPAIRYHARLALDEISRRSGVSSRPLPATEDEILLMLAHDDAEVRLRGALACYDSVRSSRLFETLTALLRTEQDAWVRASLVKAVAGYRRKVSLPLLVRCLRDPDGRVRANTVEALADLDNPVVVSMIADMIDDPEHRVQSAVLIALGKGSDGDIRPRIETMLASNRVWLQASAVYVIQEAMPVWALPVLEGFFEKNIEDRRLRERVGNLILVLRRRPNGAASATRGVNRPARSPLFEEDVDTEIGESKPPGESNAPTSH